MKKLMTIVLAIVLIAGFTSKSSAQISIGAKAGIALPMGSPFSDNNSIGFGGCVIGEYALNENMSVGLNVGYYTFGGKSVTVGTVTFDNPSFGIIPIIADFKYFLSTEGFMPYVGAGLGMYMSSVTVPAVSFMGVVVSPETTVSSSDFGFVPKVGFWMGENMKFGACLEYNIVSNANHLGLNVGILFPLGK